MPHRVLALGLDGLDITQSSGLLEGGELPALAELRQRAARFLLQPGSANGTGLTWEHFSSGLTPVDAHRSGAVEFDAARYQVFQDGARFDPFFAGLDRRTFVFDVPYTRLDDFDNVRGVTAWGAHDPGVEPTGSPPQLVAQLDARFGSYPAGRWTYASPWPSPDATAAMGRGLADAVELRTRVAGALLDEEEWDLAVVVAGEPHSAAEALWHGIDPRHPLHDHPSASAAADGFLAVMRAVDRMVESLVEGSSADAVVVFSVDGMGINSSDLPSMVLLPELLYRWSTGETLLTVPAEWTKSPDLPPIIAPDDTWDAAVARCYPRRPSAGLLRRAARHLPAGARRSLRQFAPGRVPARPASQSVDWMPATRYRGHWPAMRAFALPSYYVGRIRVNLHGREAQGTVDPADYESVCDELEHLVRSCRDPRTGESVVAKIERTEDPMGCPSSDGDLVVVWRASPWAFEHPRHGLLGPLPYRRTGGHSGPFGFADVVAPGVEPGDRAVGSPFDVPPTLVDLLGHPPLPGVSGTSLLGATKERVRGADVS